jgi:cephalosporin-C deacetylase-like acetyl esterase
VLWSLSPALTAEHSGWNVLYGYAEFDNAESMLPNHLSKAVGAIASEREKVISGLKTKAEFERYQAGTLARLRGVLGAFPSRTPLNARVVDTLERGDYAIEKVIFESRPRYYVTANVYVPRRQEGPFPAVLCPVGHWGAGKAFEDYQRLGIYLARRGFLVLVYDLPGQGERLQYYDQVVGRSLVDPGTSEYFVTIEHGVAAGQAFLASGNFASFLVWDGLRALDYLWERKDVDRKRIACTGTSGGGLQTELLSALDDRIKVSIPVSHGGCAADGPSRPGLAMADVDALIAPRPLLMIQATGDSRSSVLGKRNRHQAVAGVYRLLGIEDRTRFIVVDARHGYMKEAREAAYTWLSRWLLSKTPSADSLPEPPTAIEPETTLSCTTTGQVKTALGGETVSSLSLALAKSRVQLPSRREDRSGWRSHLMGEVKAHIKLPSQPATLSPRVLNRIDKRSHWLEKVVYYSEPEVFIPALLFLPKTPGPKPAVIFVNEGGKSAGGAAESYLEPLMEAGYVVLAIDPRGTGETKPKTSHPYNQRNYRGLTEDVEADLFYDAVRGGKTLVGLRTRDVLSGVDYRKIAAIGHGSSGLLVLHAAALDERIQSVACARTLSSYSAILQSELYTHRFSGFVPGALRVFDLPELAALIAPRPLLLLNSVDQLHRRLALEAVSDTYRGTGAVYNLLGAEGQFYLEHTVSAKQTLARYLQHIGK